MDKMINIVFISSEEDEFLRVSKFLKKAFNPPSKKRVQVDWINNWYKVESLTTLLNYQLCIIGANLNKNSPKILLQKTTYYHSKLPFVLLTEDINWEKQKEIMELGCFECLDKAELSGPKLKEAILKILFKFGSEKNQKILNETMAEKIIHLEDTNDRLLEQSKNYVTLAEDLAIAQYEAEENEIKIRTIIESSPNGIWHLTTEGETININAMLKTFLTVESGPENKNENIIEYFNKSTQSKLKRGIKKWSKGKPSNFEINYKNKKSGKKYIFQIKGGPIKHLDGSVESCLATITDITERKEAEETIKRLALTDPLTGLANRSKFNQKLNDALNLCKRLNVPLALMFLDLDKFKNVNDTYGHPAGDALLIEVSKRLLASIREVDTVARLGGDEFAIILTNLENLNSVNLVASRIIQSLAIPIAVENNFIETATSIGISFFPKDSTTKDELIQKADLALYQAKAKGRGIYNLYDEQMHKEAERIHEIEVDIDKALIRNEFRLNFQPQVNSKTKQLTGVEALIRWEHPEKGNIPPGVFIPVSDACKLAIPLGDWVLEEACRQAIQWHKNGLKNLCVSVNISLKQFLDNDFVRTVENILIQTLLDPECLELEITEGMVIDDIEDVQTKLTLLKDLGVKLAIDDFGTGYSSLAHLKRFPIDKLKVDQSFVRNLHESDIDANIVKTVINLGHSLNLKVIAEGVEEESQLEFLRKNKCDEIQGYLIAKPMEAEVFINWVNNLEKTN